MELPYKFNSIYDATKTHQLLPPYPLLCRSSKRRLSLRLIVIGLLPRRKEHRGRDSPGLLGGEGLRALHPRRRGRRRRENLARSPDLSGRGWSGVYRSGIFGSGFCRSSCSRGGLRDDDFSSGGAASGGGRLPACFLGRGGLGAACLGLADFARGRSGLLSGFGLLGFLCGWGRGLVIAEVVWPFDAGSGLGAGDGHSVWFSRGMDLVCLG